MLTIDVEIGNLIDYVKNEADRIRHQKGKTQEQKTVELMVIEARALEVYNYLKQEAQVYTLYYPPEDLQVSEDANYEYILDLLSGGWDRSVQKTIDTQMYDMISRSRKITKGVKSLSNTIKQYMQYNSVWWNRQNLSEWFEEKTTAEIDSLDQSSVITSWLRSRFDYMFQNLSPSEEDIEAA